MDLFSHPVPIPKQDGVSVPVPFPYQGGKRRLAPAILPLFPSDARILYEPFCGSGAVSIAAKARGLVASVHLGDADESIIRLWRAILCDADGLADVYEDLWDRQGDDPSGFFRMVRSRFNENHSPGDFLYLLNRIVKAAIRYDSAGRFNQSPDNRRLGAGPDTVRARLRAVSGIMMGSVAYAGGFMDTTSSCTEDDIIYMDPPYQGTSRITGSRDPRYRSGMDAKTLEEGLADMNRRGLSYILSYDSGINGHGRILDPGLGLRRIPIIAGRSAQSTLSGGSELTVESLYVSPRLADRIGGADAIRSIYE